MDFDIFINITRRQIHGIKNHRISIKICGEINKKKLVRIYKYKEIENQNYILSSTNLRFENKI